MQRGQERKSKGERKHTDIKQLQGGRGQKRKAIKEGEGERERGRRELGRSRAREEGEKEEVREGGREE